MTQKEKLIALTLRYDEPDEPETAEFQQELQKKYKKI